mgnify:CR=1 FL=1
MKMLQELFAAADHLDKSVARVVVFDIFFKMPGKTVDALGKEGDLNFCGLDAPGVPKFESSSLNRIDLIRDQIESKLDHPVAIEKQFVDGCHELIVNLGAGRQLLPAVAIRQKIPGKDLWKVEEVDYYLLGNGKPLRSLADTLSSIRTLLR